MERGSRKVTLLLEQTIPIALLRMVIKKKSALYFLGSLLQLCSLIGLCNGKANSQYLFSKLEAFIKMPLLHIST